MRLSFFADKRTTEDENVINRAANAVKLWMLLYAGLVAAAMVAGQDPGTYSNASDDVSPVAIGRTASDLKIETLMKRDVPTRRLDM